MGNQQPGQRRTETEPETKQDTEQLTTEELRSISGGVFLNIEIEKHKDNKGHPLARSSHDRKR